MAQRWDQIRDLWLTEYCRSVTIVTNPERGFLNHQITHFHSRMGMALKSVARDWECELNIEFLNSKNGTGTDLSQSLATDLIPIQNGNEI